MEGGENFIKTMTLNSKNGNDVVLFEEKTKYICL